MVIKQKERITEMKVGMIGIGGIAPAHIEVYKKLKDVELVSLCDLNLDRAKEIAAKYHVNKTYKDYWEMFEKEKLDYVDICTPVTTHAKIACDAAEAVQSILLEKPMAFNPEQCDKITSKIRQKRRNLCIGHSQLFAPIMQKATAIANSKDFDLYSFRTTLRANFENLKAHGLAPAWNVAPEQRGIIWEVCCHHAYLQLHFLPNIKEVYAVGGKVKYQVYDDFSVLLRTDTDSFGLIELSWLPRETDVNYELRGRTGRRVQIDWEHDYLYELAQDPPFTIGLVAKNMLTDDKRLLNKWAKFESCYIHKRKLLPTFNLITQYLDSIKKNEPSPVTPEDGRNAVNLLESIEKSLNEKQPVPFSR
jgi:predicted dehydrogenase